MVVFLFYKTKAKVKHKAKIGIFVCVCLGILLYLWTNQVFEIALSIDPLSIDRTCTCTCTCEGLLCAINGFPICRFIIIYMYMYMYMATSVKGIPYIVAMFYKGIGWYPWWWYCTSTCILLKRWEEYYGWCMTNN